MSQNETLRVVNYCVFNQRRMKNLNLSQHRMLDMFDLEWVEQALETGYRTEINTGW